MGEYRAHQAANAGAKAFREGKPRDATKRMERTLGVPFTRRASTPPADREPSIAPPAQPTDCPSCSGLNTSCPEGCGRDPVTGELDGSTLTQPAADAVEMAEHTVAKILLSECHMEPSDRNRIAAEIVAAILSLGEGRG